MSLVFRNVGLLSTHQPEQSNTLPTTATETALLSATSADEITNAPPPPANQRSTPFNQHHSEALVDTVQNQPWFNDQNGLGQAQTTVATLQATAGFGDLGLTAQAEAISEAVASLANIIPRTV